MSVPKPLESFTDIWFDGLPERLSEAADKYDLASHTQSWESMDEISSNTIYDGIEVFGDAAIVEQDEYYAPATVYVTLQYGDRRDGGSFSDSYPARVYFSVNTEAKSVTVERIEIDNSSFYGDED